MPDLPTKPVRRGFDAVDRYALTRSRSRGDVYGWAPLPDDAQPRALLLIAQGADPKTFPETISGVRIVLKPVPEPTGAYVCQYQ